MRVLSRPVNFLATRKDPGRPGLEEPLKCGLLFLTKSPATGLEKKISTLRFEGWALTVLARP